MSCDDSGLQKQYAISIITCFPPWPGLFMTLALGDVNALASNEESMGSIPSIYFCTFNLDLTPIVHLTPYYKHPIYSEIANRIGQNLFLVMKVPVTFRLCANV